MRVLGPAFPRQDFHCIISNFLGVGARQMCVEIGFSQMTLDMLYKLSVFLFSVSKIRTVTTRGTEVIGKT